MIHQGNGEISGYVRFEPFLNGVVCALESLLSNQCSVVAAVGSVAHSGLQLVQDL